MPDPSGRAPAIDERAWTAVAGLLSLGTSSPGALAPGAILPGSGDGIGSNCWALAGSRGGGGGGGGAGGAGAGGPPPAPAPAIPPEGPGYKLVGFSFAGIPGLVIGHNDRIAW